ncbi:MAG TPA: response regulator [Polyangia bacterium]|nr:response regulator [Polyangia bacterium]
MEDDADIREVMTAVLEDRGFSVICAPNGRAGLEQLRAGATPEVIVLDLMMPVMDGWAFREAQLSDPRLADIPTVVITASGFHPESIRQELGEVGYLAKPMTPSALIAAIIDRATPSVRTARRRAADAKRAPDQSCSSAGGEDLACLRLIGSRR